MTATEHDGEKSSCYVLKNWDFHLVTPPKCQKSPSSIPKTAHVKFRATSGSVPTTFVVVLEGSELGRCRDKVSLP